MILEKKIDLSGVYRPVVPQIYNPVLNELKIMGIELKEEFGCRNLHQCPFKYPQPPEAG